MDTNRMKNAVEWFYSKVFKDETIKPRPAAPAEKIPSQIRAARSLQNAPGKLWQSRESIFIKQGKLLAGYEDDYTYSQDTVRYFPTYEALTDQELRAYFSWRTKLRKGNLEKTSLSFAFLYIYELINGIGVSDPLDGYYRLKQFRNEYGALDNGIASYMDQWITDYVVYYCLDPVLLSDSPQAIFDGNLSILIHIQDYEDARVMQSVKALASKWLERSKFYAANQKEMDLVIVRTLRKMSDHYASKCKRTMVEQFFGSSNEFQYQPFSSAVFADRQKKRSFEYAVDPLCVYRCKSGLWTVQRYTYSSKSNPKLNNILKTIDALMRRAYGYKHPIKCEMETKWILKLIQEEIQALQEEKKQTEASKITIDYTALSRIRQEAAVTQEKLTVEEEMEEEPLIIAPEPEPESSACCDCPLNPAEFRLLQCLLYGKDTGWVRTEGHILSVLLDGINEKLYDSFLDTVVDDTPAVIEDYIDELKEMIKL